MVPVTLDATGDTRVGHTGPVTVIAQTSAAAAHRAIWIPDILMRVLSDS